VFSWRAKSPVQTVKAFISAMNGRDFARVEKLLAKDMRLIDNANKELRGAHHCLALLERVAELAPDYRLDVNTIVERGDEILISGNSITASEEMAVSTQWRARVRDGKLQEWQSYSNRLTPSMIATVLKTQE